MRNEIDSVLWAGPPLVNAMIWSNTIRKFLMESTILMVKKGMMSGKVRRLNLVQPLAPSSAPASYTSSGTVCRPEM